MPSTPVQRTVNLIDAFMVSAASEINARDGLALMTEVGPPDWPTKNIFLRVSAMTKGWIRVEENVKGPKKRTAPSGGKPKFSSHDARLFEFICPGAQASLLRLGGVGEFALN